MPEEVKPAVETPVTPVAPAVPAVETKPTAEDQTPEKPAAEQAEGEESSILGDAGKEEEKVAISVPEKYEFKAPEGFAIDDKAVETLSPVLKEIGISNDGLQKLVDAYAPIVKQQISAALQSAQQENTKVFNDLVEGWKTETKQVIGADFDKANKTLGKVLRQFGTPELIQDLNDYGFGNNPHLVKFVLAVGKAISEDTFVEGKTNLASNSEEAELQKLYPSMIKK